MTRDIYHLIIVINKTDVQFHKRLSNHHSLLTLQRLLINFNTLIIFLPIPTSADQTFAIKPIITVPKLAPTISSLGILLLTLGAPVAIVYRAPVNLARSAF